MTKCALYARDAAGETRGVVRSSFSPQLIRIVESAGFRLEVWRDTTAEAFEYFHKRRELTAAFDVSPISVLDGQRARQGVALLAALGTV